MCPVSYTVVYCVELWCACHVSILQVMLVLYLWVLYTVCVSCVWLQPSPLILCFDVSCGKVCISEHLYVHDAFMRMMWTKRLKGLIFQRRTAYLDSYYSSSLEPVSSIEIELRRIYGCGCSCL